MKFSLAVTAALLLSCSLLVDAACERIVTRREIRELTAAQRNAFIEAVKKLQAERPQPNAYDKLTGYHITYSKDAHGIAAFLPWHRVYLQKFQEELFRVDSSVVLPYWDWAADSQAPETSPVFDWFGGNGRGTSNCVQDGPFTSYRPYYPTPNGCFSRSFDGLNGAIGAFYSTDFVANLQATATTYDTFRRSYEGTAHARVHNAIGASFATMSSPNDLVFWLHHATVDKHWAEWQALGHANDYGPSSPDERLVPWDVTARSTFDTRAEPYCYTYSNMNTATATIRNSPMPDASGINDDLGDMGGSLLRRSLDQMLKRRSYTSEPAPISKLLDSLPEGTILATKKPPYKCIVRKKPDPLGYLLIDGSDRSNLVNLRVPPPIPEEWCKMNNLKVEDVRAAEAENARLIKILNNVEGYVSQCALINRPELLSKLVETTKHFTAGFHNGTAIPIETDCGADPATAVANLITQVKSKLAAAPDSEELAKLVGSDTAKLMSGYNGGVNLAKFVNETFAVFEDIADVDLSEGRDIISSLVDKLTGTPRA